MYKTIIIHIMVICVLFSYKKKKQNLNNICSAQLLDTCLCHNAMFIYICIIIVKAIVFLQSCLEIWMLHVCFHV